MQTTQNNGPAPGTFLKKLLIVTASEEWKNGLNAYYKILKRFLLHFLLERLLGNIFSDRLFMELL